MTWFFLIISLALFCVRGFRPVLEAPLALLLPDIWTGEFGASAWAKSTATDLDRPSLQVSLINLGTGRVLDRFFTLRRYVTPAQLRQRALDADQSGNPEFVTFAILHLPEPEMREDVIQLTDRVVAANPKLTWLIYFVAARYATQGGSEPFMKGLQARVEKLEAWDPDNAAPHLLRARMMLGGDNLKWKVGASNQSKVQDILARRLEWQKEMETAFGLPRYDSYALQRYELERHVMSAQGWNNPLVMLYTLGGGIPNLMAARDYANLLVRDLGADAEAEGRIDDALHHYRTAARFGERLRLQSHTLIEQLIGMSIQKIAYERLVPALNKAGKADEGAAVEFAQKQLLVEIDRRFANPLARTSNRTWSALLTGIAGTSVWVFLILTLASVAYVNAKLLVRRDKKGRLYQVMTILENYAPVMLFTSCLTLGLIYAPFAQNFSSYMNVSEPLISWDQFQGNSFPIPQGLGRMDLPLQNPYHGFIAYALVFAGVMLAIAIIRSRIAARKKSLPA
jgi:hypothetical protein